MATPAIVDNPSRSESWWRRFCYTHRVGLTLILLTLIGGGLRFWALDRPSLWGDEAATYARICGTFREMLDVLRDAFFPPLHYLLYFWLSRHVPMDPFGMRLMPAIAGTLMIPTMYFLARQLTNTRVALTTAAVTAFAAYMLAYSRDGKMYMEFWFAGTLSTACFLWWLRTGRSTAWLAWIAAGAAMVGLHGLGFVFLALQLIFFLTSGRMTALRATLLVVGLAVISAGDAVHYGSFNVVAERISKDDDWRAAGIDWADSRNQGQPTPLIIADAAGAFLLSFLWIQEPARGIVVERVPELMAWALGVLLALLVIGALPWPATWTGDAPRRRRRDSDNADSAVAEAQLQSAGWVEKPWRVWLWLSIWVVLAGYAFYCVSTDRPTSPVVWMTTIGSLAHGKWLMIVACVVSACAMTQVSAYVSRLLAVGVVGLLGWTLYMALFRAGDSTDMWVYRWADQLVKPAVLGALLGVILAMWFDRSGDTFKTRLATTVRFILVAAFLWLACWIVYMRVEAYFEKRAFLLGSEQAAVGGRKSIWMPRWVAIMWPAVAIVVSILLLRLPTRPVRWLAITAFIAVNLAQFYARLYAGTEAPHARVAADVIAVRDDKSLMTFVERRHGGVSPGTASIQEWPGSYYLNRATHTPNSPQSFRQNKLWNELPFERDASSDNIVRYATNQPQVRRMIVWNDYDSGTQIPDDALTERLGDNWRIRSRQTFVVRSFWNWADFYQLVRREYVRVDGPPKPQ